MAAQDADVVANQRTTVAIVATCLVLAVVSLVLRLYARLVSAAKLCYDDCWMVLVMAVCIAMTVSDFVGLHFGSGQRQADLPPEMVTSFMQNLYVYMLLWSTGMFSVKVGILLFYWRVFSTRDFRIAASAVGCFSLGIFFAFFFSFMFQCVPVERFWNEELEEGKCFNQSAFYNASAIINVVGDVAVLALPLPVVWSLHTSRSKKWSLSFLFLPGAFVCVASVFRIVAVRAIDPHDFTFTNVSGGLWSTVEVEIGFICANLPAIRPLLTKWFGIGGSRTGYGSSNTHSNGVFAGSKPGSGSRSGHVMLGSKGGRDTHSEAEFTKHGNKSDEMELTGTRTMGAIQVKTDVEMSVDDWNGQGQERSRMDSYVHTGTLKTRS